jgi:lysophospholipase L1-like esterase
MKKIVLAIVSILIAFSGHAQKEQKDWAKFYRYEQANADVKTRPHAVLMGDSITDNWLKKDGEFFSSNNLAGRGISGQTTSHMLVRFRRDVLDLSPKYVVILAGTNDIAQNNGLITHENILGNIQSMCELATAHKIKPILCSILPANRFNWRKELTPAEDIIKMNEMIKEYAEKNKIPYIDYHSALKDEHNGLPEKYSPDGVHPNIDCYKIMEQILMKFL